MTVAIRVLLPSPTHTRALGEAVAQVVEGGDVVLLLGELGAGKTTFTKGLVGALGVREEVTSPTFTLLHCYPSVPPVAHVDCWRLESSEEVAELGLEEILDDGGVAVIEWGELAAPLHGRDALTLRLELVDAEGDDPVAPSSRVALLAPTGESWSHRMRHLQQACREEGLESELLATASDDERAASR